MQALNVGQTLTDTFTVTTVDGTQQLVTITINGANDTAVISGDVTGSVTEAGGVDNGTPGTPTATGDLNSTDVDNPSDAWTAVGTATASTKGYGTYTLTAAGVWTYTLDNSNADVQARNVGQILSDTFTVVTVDGTSQVVTIIINGTNDAAVITGDTYRDAWWRPAVSTTARRARPTATGDLNSTDVDNPNDVWTAVNTPTASGYGSYTLAAAGVWTYTLNNSNRRRAGAQCRADADRHVHRHHGRRHRPAGHHHHQRHERHRRDQRRHHRGGDRGRRCRQRHAGHPTATGDLNSTDVDNPSDAWTAVGTATASTKGYGTYTLTDAGLWTYTLDNSNPAVQARNVGQILSDTFTVFAVDGTSQVVTIIINGTNDAAVVSGDHDGKRRGGRRG